MRSEPHKPDGDSSIRAAFPYPLCAACGEQPSCRARGQVKADYPRCRRPLLGTSLPRVADLLAWWNRFHGCRDSRLDDLQRVLLTRLAIDRMRFSEVFEPSYSHDGDGWHFWRFSYAFPGFRHDPAADTRDLLAFCRPFGDELCGWAQTLLSPACDPAVSLPLAGLAYDAPGSWRVKLYLQFRDDAGDDSLRIAARLTGRADLPRCFRGRSLHLVGIDLGPRGIAGAKLYCRYPRIPSRDVRRVIGPVELIGYLADSAFDELRNLLVIHRMHRPDDPELETPVEVDFALPDNDLCWHDLAASPTLQAARAGDGPLTALESSFALAVRRVSVPVGHTRKLNVYYVPTDVDLESAGGSA